MKIRRIIIAVALVLLLLPVIFAESRVRRNYVQYPEEQIAYIVDTIEIPNPIYITDEGWDWGLLTGMPSLILSYDTSVRPIEMMDSALFASYLNDSLIYYTTYYMFPDNRPFSFFQKFYCIDFSDKNAMLVGGDGREEFVKRFSFNGKKIRVFQFKNLPKKFFLCMINIQHFYDGETLPYDKLFYNVPCRSFYLPVVFPATYLNKKKRK